MELDSNDLEYTYFAACCLIVPILNELDSPVLKIVAKYLKVPPY
jgi:hypothetical protein